MVQRVDPFSPGLVMTVNRKRKPQINLDPTIFPANTRIILKNQDIKSPDDRAHLVSYSVIAKLDTKELLIIANSNRILVAWSVLFRFL